MLAPCEKVLRSLVGGKYHPSVINNDDGAVDCVKDRPEANVLRNCAYPPPYSNYSVYQYCCRIAATIVYSIAFLAVAWLLLRKATQSAAPMATPAREAHWP